MSERIPTLYPLLTPEQKAQVETAMKEYNGTSLDETFTDPEEFFYKVYRTKKTFFPYTRRTV
ncbi:MAG TPA: hypothetical protein VGK06_15240 [Methanosarcina sp.]|jgi:hypothetical protein